MPKPVFRRLTNGELKLDYTEAARSLKLSRVDAKKDAAQNKSLTAEEVKKDAVKTVQKRGGNISDKTEVLSEYKIQFGGFRGQSFKWVLENALGYAGWLVDSMRNETATSSALSQNKHAFKEYAQLFPECREVIAKKSEERLNKSKQQTKAATPTPTAIQSSAGRATSVAGVRRNVGISTSFHTATAAAVAPLLNRNASPHQISAAISRSLSTSKRSSVPNIPASSRITAARHKTPQDATCSRSPSQSPESNDDELCCVVDKVERELGISRAKPSTSSSKPSQSSGQPSVSKQLQSHGAQSHEGILRAEQTSTTSSKTSQSSPQPSVSNQSQTDGIQYHEQEILLPPGWKQTLPKADREKKSSPSFAQGPCWSSLCRSGFGVCAAVKRARL